MTLQNPTGYMSRQDRLRQFKERSFIIPFILVSLCFFIGHFSGMTTLQTYAVQIFHTLKAPMDKYYATLLLGIVEVIGALICVCVIHYTGKRPLALISTIGCGFCFLGTATYAHFLNEIPGQGVDNIVSNNSAIQLNLKYITTTTNPIHSENNGNIGLGFLDAHAIFANDYVEDIPDLNDTLYDSFLNESETVLINTTALPEQDDSMFIELHGKKSEDEDENKYAWIPLTLLLGSALLSHAGIRLLPWILIGEVFPAKIRAFGAGFASGMGYVFGFLANKLFLGMLSSMTLPGTFWFYSAISLLGALILFWILPETEGRTLLEIENHFNGKRSLDTTNANITPKKSSVASKSFQLEINASSSAFERNLQAHNYDPKEALSFAQKRGNIVVAVPSAAAMGMKKTKETHSRSSKEELTGDAINGKANLAYESEKEVTRL